MEAKKTEYKKTYFRVDEVAQYFSISRRTIYRIIENNELPALRIRGSLRIHRDDLKQYELYLKTNNNKF